MACFTACLAQALVVYGVKKTVQTKHKALANKLTKLIYMLLAGSFLLLIEHIWHGEITLFYPFLTAAKDPEDTKVMIHEILTVGSSMDVAITLSWAIYYKVLSFKSKKEYA